MISEKSTGTNLDILPINYGRLIHILIKVQFCLQFLFSKSSCKILKDNSLKKNLYNFSIIMILQKSIRNKGAV